MGTCFSYPAWATPIPHSADDFVKNRLQYDVKARSDNIKVDEQQANLAEKLNEITEPDNKQITT